jgi:hypothetical protein
MFLTALMFIVAIALSAVAAFYSIVGLTAIFAAAVVPIIIMGTILEVAKVVTTIWLHEYWHRCRLAMKLYLVPAVVILMIITSMGIFGFLSKAHLDQVVPTGDVAAQVALIDEKINNERDTIANARSLLAQLDKAVIDISNAPDREVNGRVISSAERALQVRRQQARDRANLTQTIEQAQARIVTLQEEKAPFAKDLRKIEAEVGPVKYIAALIYGDNPDTNLLEKAVRWVIIIIVAVFDPLAIMMLLAATESLRWHRESSPRKEPDYEHHAPDRVDQTRDQPSLPPDDRLVEPLATQAESAEDLQPPTQESVATGPVENQILNEVQTDAESKNTVVESTSDFLDTEELDHESDPLVKQAKNLWKDDHPGMTLKEQRRKVLLGELDHEPWMDYLDDPRLSRDPGFGNSLPPMATKGDIFVLTSTIPTSLFKHNGDKWINIEKTFTDQYAYNDAYIDYLITQIGSGVYDPDLLSDAERNQIDHKLRQAL